jgi:hypothetical protein
MKAPCHVWKTDDGRMVKDGDRDAAVLLYAAGDEMDGPVPEWIDSDGDVKTVDESVSSGEPDSKTIKFGSPSAQDEPEGKTVKMGSASADKARKPAANNK